MTFRQLALKNIVGNWHRYIAFFLSSTFSVMIFYIYASFIFHPDVVSGQIQAAGKVRQGLVACEYIIAIFSFFFILYASYAFLKTRKKEIGLLTLFGMTPSQINRLLFYENTGIALLAITVGCALGTLFSKLFFMALAQLLEVDSPIRFVIVPKALGYTFIGFLLLFLVITLISLIGIGKNSIVELLKASRKPKTMPIVSKWLTAVAVLCLGTGYFLAYITTAYTLVMFMLPILFLVIVGTYFLFTQASVAILRKLQRTPSVYYRSTHFITISQLVFKMKDNARMLFMVSILSAVILTASGTIFMMYQGFRQQYLDNYPQTIGYLSQGSKTPSFMMPDQVKRVLKKQGASVDYHFQAEGLSANVTAKSSSMKRPLEGFLLPESQYNAIVTQTGKYATVRVEPGRGIYVTPYPESRNWVEGDIVSMNTVGQELKLQLEGTSPGSVINPYGGASNLFIVDDGEYKELLSKASEDQKLLYTGYELKDWEKSAHAIDLLEQTIPKNQQEHNSFSNRVQSYATAKQFSSLTMFVGVFVSILFFMASGSMLYFKLFTELQEDQAQFKALSRIGLSMQEIRKITTTQIGIIFFVPVIVGAVHAAFAYKMLGSMMSNPVWQYGTLVISIYAIMQLLYFLLTRRAYMKQMKGF